MNPTLKRYLLSSLVTFIATFSAAVVPFIGDIEPTHAAIIAITMVGIRAGAKAIFESLSKINAMSLDDLENQDGNFL